MMLAKLKPKPTDEQCFILDQIRSSQSNLQINAFAGTGKSATLKMIDDLMPESLLSLYLVFNKRNAEEAIDSNEFRPLIETENRRPVRGTKIQTLNGCGHGIWAQKAQDKISLDKDKTKKLFYTHLQTFTKPSQDEAWEEWSNVKQGVELSKALGYLPEGNYPNAARLCTWSAVNDACDEPLSPLAKELVDEILLVSVKTAIKGFIDFNDQVYMPALFGGPFPRYPVGMVDETQDLSPVNHAMLDRLGFERLISVGDPAQTIYTFRGAKANGMADIRRRFAMSEADLSISFRCSQRIVEEARWRVPTFKWFNQGGVVEELSQIKLDEIREDSAIICRNNAPLFRLAIRLLSSGRNVRVHGSDMGPRLIAIMRKLGPEGMSQESTLSAIEDWEGERVEKGSKTAKDIADCMRVFVSYGPTLKHALLYIDSIFKQHGSIELLTGHKSKGLEWNRVYFLDQFLIGEDEQDLNLRYVIQTRAKQELYYINSREIQ